MPTPTKTGYTFLGWTGTGLSAATKTVTISKGSTGNRSYTANWSPNYSELNTGSSLNSSFISLAGSAANIRSIKMSSSVPGGLKTVEIQSSYSPAKIRAYYQNNAIYIVAEKSPIYMNANSGMICDGFSRLTDISAFSSFNASKVTSIGGLFADCTSLTNLNSIGSWNTSQVTNMSYMCWGCTSLTNASAINGWDVSKVDFIGCLMDVEHIHHLQNVVADGIVKIHLFHTINV